MRRLAATLFCGLLVACDHRAKSPDYSALLDDAGGLKSGSVVYIAGVQVGRVNQVTLAGHQARIQFDLRALAGAKVTEQTCIRVGFYGASSDAHLLVDLGDGAGTAIAPGGELRCVTAAPLEKAGAQALASAEKVLTAALSGEGIVPRLLTDKAFADKVERFFDNPPTTSAGGAPAGDAVDPALVGQPPGAPGPKAPAPMKVDPLSTRD